MATRQQTGTWHPERPKEPTPIVQDPLQRAILMDERRHLLARVGSIEKYLGIKAAEDLSQAS